jgi:predicted MPP superfamily phosphohydrolase
MENKNCRKNSVIFRKLIQNNKKKKIKKRKYFKFNLKNKILNTDFIKNLWGNFSKNLTINNINIIDKQLPVNFNGFKILFISDLHLDIKPNSLEYIKNLKLPEYDVLIFGGDFFDKYNYNKENIQDFIFLFNKLKTTYNFAVLGNHDSTDILELENTLGLKFLINESVLIKNKNEEIILTGIDDITYFKSQYQEECLIKDNIFKIMISHNPDFLKTTEKNDYNIQLSGHTHGGQILLPFNFILYPHTKYKFAISGLWKYKKLQGITTSGFGCAGHPLRNIDPEMVLITLKNK